MLAISRMIDMLRAWPDFRVPDVQNSVAAFAASTRDELIAELVRHPMFEGRGSIESAIWPATVRRYCGTFCRRGNLCNAEWKYVRRML